MVGPVPFGDIEHVAEEEKQINKLLFCETTKRKYVRLILLSCSLPHFLLHLCIFRHLKEAAVKLKLTIVDNFTPSPS